MDMNDLKHINDSFGHEAGDRLIIALTDYIANMDQKPDIFGRTGGDEFALVYKDKSKEEVHRIIQIVRNHFIKIPFQYNKQEILSITFGYGVSTFPQEAEDVFTLFKNADMLMYMDKKHFKDKNKKVLS
jgi:diguanylate cyclase (GGDEF)-like protein